MAFEIKPRGELSNSIDAVESHETRLEKSRERKFVDNDRATTESIMEIYDTNKEKLAKGTDDEQIMLVSTLHAQREFMGWFIGESLQVIGTAITEGKKSGYASLNEWLEVNSDKLGFSKSTGYDYIKIRQVSTLDQFKRLGIKKTLVLSQLRDEKKREQVAKEVISEKLTVEETRDKVDAIISREKDKARKVVQAKKDEAFDEVKYHVERAGPAAILLSTDRKYLEALNNVILSEEPRLKVKVLDEYRRITGR